MVAQTWERLSYYMVGDIWQAFDIDVIWIINTAHHAGYRFSLYISTQTEPVSTSVRYIRNDSLLFPSVVLCPYRQTLENDTAHLDPLKLRRMFDEDQHEDREPFKDSLNAMYHLVNHYDVRTLWATTGWDLESQISTVINYLIKSCKELMIRNNYFYIQNSVYEVELIVKEKRKRYSPFLAHVFIIQRQKCPSVDNSTVSTFDYVLTEKRRRKLEQSAAFCKSFIWW